MRKVTNGGGKTTFHRLLIFGLVFGLMTNIAYPASIIRGTVSDSQTARNLVGANVFLVGTALGSATDIEGNYRIGS
ncbi:MAG: carboxypeptidase-like regulatory domain-containing protein, partial [Candidatus Neomarinimicrobiota bacterium]